MERIPPHRISCFIPLNLAGAVRGETGFLTITHTLHLKRHSNMLSFWSRGFQAANPRVSQVRWNSARSAR